MATHMQRAQLAGFAGVVCGLHAQAKTHEANGIPEMDMVACALEDIYGMLLPVIDNISQPEAFELQK